MGYNKIPLALKFNDDTGNAEGLIEFQLNVSDIGDICEDSYNPSPGDVLTYDSDLDCWTASATPAVAAGALSALTDVCEDTPSDYQALVWNGSAWCPSTIPTGGGGGGGVTSVNGDTGPDVGLYFSSLSGTNIRDPGGDGDETDGKLPQIIEWTPGTDPNTGEWTNTYNDSVYIEVHNNTTATLAKGTAVYIEGVQGAETPRVEPAQANATGTMPCVGVIYEPIASGKRGLLVSFGTAGGLNWDSPPGAVDIGKTVYVSPDNPGNLTLTKPTTTTSDLIQNVGILVKEGTTSSKIKVTGVGRSNDIPNDLDVVGSVTVGDTVISQTDAVLSNADQNSVMITNGASAVSSLSGASGSMVYFDGDTPAPILRTFDNIVSHEGYTIQPGETYLTEVDPPDIGLNVNNQIPYRIDSTTFGTITTTTNGRAFMATDANLSDLTDYTGTTSQNHILQRNGTTQWETVTVNTALTNASERVEDHNIEDLANVDSDAVFSDGHVLVYQEGGDPAGFQPFASSIFGTGGDSISHNELLNLSADDHTQYVLADGTRVVSGTLSALDFSATSGSVASTPTAANHIANKSYVDSQVTTPSYFQALASGTLTLTVNATEYDLGWSTSGTYAITDPAGNLEVQDGDSQGNNINVSGDGVYQIDCSVQTTNTTNGGRVGAIIRIYRDTGDGHGFAEISELRASNYASRGIESIVTGTTHLNTLISLNDGDKLKFTIMRNTLTGTPNVTSNGTYLRIIKIA